MGMKFRRKKNLNVMRVGIKIAITIIALWVSGFMLNVIGDVINGTSSPFYDGLSLIGYTLQDGVTGTTQACNADTTGGSINNCVTATTGDGILAVVGLIAVAFLVFEFVDISY